MSRKKPRPPRAGAGAPPLAEPPAAASRAPLLFAAALILLTLVHAWWSRYTLNPDGVAYLDLSGRLLAGDLESFVQGYWSPLYPAVVATVGLLTSRSPVAMLTVAHLLNGAAVIAAILLLWHWGRRAGRPRFTLVALSGLMLVSTGLPRIEAVTPDVFSLALMGWLAYELLERRGERALLTGLALGLAFLVKTSAWPWLLLSVPLRLWAASDGAGRRQVLASSGVAALLAATWIVPLSLKTGHATVGSAARLNYCWYLESCDSRTPDTHRGDHTAYRTAILDSTHRVVWAKFDEADRWTYAPWSDPTAWEAGVRTMTKGPAEAALVVPYWGRQLQRTLLLWLLPVLLAVVIPWVLLEWSAGMWRLWRPEFRPVAATAFLGIAGVLQFVLVHAEPRLIAPSAFLFVLALLAHRPAGDEIPDRRLLRRLVTIVGVLTVASYAFTKLRDGYQAERRLERTLAMLAADNARITAAGLSQDRIVIFGPAIPVTAAAYLSRAHVVAQVPPASLDALLDQSPQRQRHTFFTLFAGLAQVAWLTTPDGGVTLVAIPTTDSTTTPGPTR